MKPDTGSKIEDIAADEQTQAYLNKDEGASSAISKGRVGYVISAVAIILALFHLYTSYFGGLPAIKHRIFHLTLVLCMVYMLYPTKNFAYSSGHVPGTLIPVLSSNCAIISSWKSPSNKGTFKPHQPSPP